MRTINLEATRRFNEELAELMANKRKAALDREVAEIIAEMEESKANIKKTAPTAADFEEVVRFFNSLTAEDVAIKEVSTIESVEAEVVGVVDPMEKDVEIPTFMNPCYAIDVAYSEIEEVIEEVETIEEDVVEIPWFVNRGNRREGMRY